MSGASTRHALRRLAHDRRGVAAVEFAVIAPFMILLLFGGYVVTEAVAVSRKVTITTRALADLVSQYTTMTGSDMSTVEGAATQILTPFSSAPLSMRITQISITSVAGITVSLVSWSTGVNATPYKPGISIQLPTNMPNQAGMTYILAETTYAYQPGFGLPAFASVNLGDKIYMLPRLSASIAYSGT